MGQDKIKKKIALDRIRSGKIGKEEFKGHKIFPKVSFLPWLHPVKIWPQTVSG